MYVWKVACMHVSLYGFFQISPFSFGVGRAMLDCLLRCYDLGGACMCAWNICGKFIIVCTGVYVHMHMCVAGSKCAS